MGLQVSLIVPFGNEMLFLIQIILDVLIYPNVTDNST
jgi:hypothetical protein